MMDDNLLLPWTSFGEGGGSGIVLALYIYPSGPHDLHHSVYVTKY